MIRLTFLLMMAAALFVSCANTNPDVPQTPVDDGYDAEPIKQDLFNTSNGDGVVPPYRIPEIGRAHV